MTQFQEYVKQGSGTGQARLNVETGGLVYMFQVTNDRDHRQSGFDHQALIPSAFGTQLQIGWQPFHRTKAEVGQDKRAVFEVGNHRQEILVERVEGRRRPINDLTVVVEEPAAANADRPAPFSFRLRADLPGAAAFPDRDNQFNQILCRIRWERLRRPARWPSGYLATR